MYPCYHLANFRTFINCYSNVTGIESPQIIAKCYVSWCIASFSKTLTVYIINIFFSYKCMLLVYSLGMEPMTFVWPPSLKEAAPFAQMDGFLCPFEWIYLPLLEPPVNTLSLHLVPDSALHTTAPLPLLTQRLAQTLTRTGNRQPVQTIERHWQSHLLTLTKALSTSSKTQK